LKSLIVGFGSIGQRHAQILTDLGHSVAIVSRRDVEVAPLFADLETALAEFGPDYIVIASRSSEHSEDLVRLSMLGFAGKVLVEKPLYHDPQRPLDHKFSQICVGYNLRFHPAVQRFQALLQEREIASVHCYVGHYLPDWRPGTDYRITHSAHKAQGGGALRELSHELDYLVWIFGGWTQLCALGGHFSSLEIDSDDVYSLLIKTGRAPLVSLTMNYLHSSPRRETVAHTDAGTYSLDLIAGTITHGDEVETFAVGKNDTYVRQHQAVCGETSDGLCSLEEGERIVDMIAAAERASAEKKWVTPVGAAAN
jgi:predicted dehydrogenase